MNTTPPATPKRTRVKSDALVVEPKTRKRSKPDAIAEPKTPKRSNPDALADPKPQTRRRPRKVSRKPVARQDYAGFRNKLFLISLEALALAVTAVSAIIVLLGYSANWFSGTRFFSNLLPFAMGVLGLVLLASVLLIGWWKLRKYLQIKAAFWSPALAGCLALGMVWFSMQDSFSLALGHYRTLVGGKREAGRVTLAHQVYAAYRRYDTNQLLRLVNRAQEFNPVIQEAAKAFDIDPNLLQGVAATESSFLPRDSLDGGHGLFQITLVPKIILEKTGKRLKVDKLSLDNPRHNAYIAAATLKHYLAEMNNDLFLGLLAYNIGPANGGLRFIMQQYGARDFITIQPYLQQLPRDYPIRVLSYSLAFRLWDQEGKLPGYEEGNNATRIQRIGIPGLQMEL